MSNICYKGSTVEKVGIAELGITFISDNTFCI